MSRIDTGEVLLEGTLPAPIRPDDCVWTLNLEHQSVEITLVKVEAERWHILTEEAPEVSETFTEEEIQMIRERWAHLTSDKKVEFTILCVNEGLAWRQK